MTSSRTMWKINCSYENEKEISTAVKWLALEMWWIGQLGWTSLCDMTTNCIYLLRVSKEDTNSAILTRKNGFEITNRCRQITIKVEDLFSPQGKIIIALYVCTRRIQIIFQLGKFFDSSNDVWKLFKISAHISMELRGLLLNKT